MFVLGILYIHAGFHSFHILSYMYGISSSALIGGVVVVVSLIFCWWQRKRGESQIII